MPSVLDVLRAQDAATAAPPADADVAAPPKPQSVLDVVNAAKPTPSVLDVVNAHAAKPGEAGGAMVGRLAERAETPEFIRKPDDDEPVPTVGPDEPPPLLKRPYEWEPGSYGKPTRLEKAALYATRIGVPIVAGVGAGALAGPGAPVVGPLAGASAATATELGLQKYEKARGFRKDVSPGGVVLQGVLGGFQGLPLPATLSAPVRFGARTLEGAGVGTGATTAGTLIEEKRLPTKEELAWGAGTGAAFGAVGGGIETKGVPYLHERSPEFVGPREGNVMSRRQLRAADAARVTDTGETVLPPVGEPGPPMVTRPGETIGGEPGEMVGPPAPAAQQGPLRPFEERHPVGSTVEYDPPGSIGVGQGRGAQRQQGTVVRHVTDPVTGDTFAEVENPRGLREHVGDVDNPTPVTPQAAAPESQRVTPVHTYESVMGMSADDLEAAHADQRAYEQSAAVDVFGPEGAKRYEALQRRANSTIAPHEQTKLASDEIAKMEAGLTPAQEARLFGFGEEGYNADELRRIAGAARDYDPANVADLPDAHLLNTAGRELISGNLKDDPVAAIRLHGALRELGNRGYDKSVIQDAVARRAAQEGISPGDAQELMDANLRDLQERQAQPQPVQPAQGLPAARALPTLEAPEPPPGGTTTTDLGGGWTEHRTQTPTGETVFRTGPEGTSPPPPPPPPGGEGPPPGGEYAGTTPPDETGPFGQRPTFRTYRGLGEALTGDEIGPQLGADSERMTRAIDSVDREFGDILDEPSRDRLKQQLRDNQDRFEYLGRGKQTMARTQGLGRDLLFDLDAAKLEPKGTVWNPEQTASAKNHIVSLDAGIRAAQEAFDAHPTAEHGLILQKAVQDQIDAFNIYRARGAEAGRTVNIYKAGAEDIGSGNQKLMMAALRRGVPPDKLAEIIRSTTPDQINARAEMLMALSDRGPWHTRLKNTLQTIFISNILSGPPPQERNILGNAVNALLSPVAKVFGAAHERLAGVPDAERTVRLGEVGAHFVGLYDAQTEAIYKAFEVMKNGYTREQAISYNLPQHELGIGRHPALRAALNIVPRSLGGMDMYFRVIGQEASMNSQAFVKARNQALVEQAGHTLPEGVSFRERLSQLYDEHQAHPTLDVQKQAADEAARGVYQEQDRVARTMQFIRDQVPGGGFIAPFITTSTNIAKQGLHWSPAGYVMPSTRGRGTVSARTRTIHLGEAHAGTAGMALLPVVLWAAGGKLHGAGPDDPDEFAEWRQTHVPNSLELGGHMIGINQLGPLALPLTTIGNAWDKYDEIQRKHGHVEPKDAEDIAIAALGGAAQSVLDQPYMQGISNAIDVARHPKEPRYWARFTKDIATGFIPGAGMLRWIEQIRDPTIRDAKTIPEQMQKTIPGYSESLPPKLDAFGQPITIQKEGGAWGRALLPIDVERVRRDPLRDELAQQSMKLTPPGAGTPTKGEPPYTPTEGLAIREAKGQQLRAELEDLIASDQYQEADAEMRRTLLKSVISRTRGAIGARARGLRDDGLDVESLRWGE